MLLKDFFSHVNWLAVVVATLAYFIIGALWYSKILFAPAWMADHKLSPPSDDAKKKLPMLMLGSLVMSFIVTLAIGILVYGLQASKCVAGIKIGLLCSALGVVPILMSHMYTAKPMRVWFIDAGYHVVAYVLISIILSVWH